jgi:hypothetical protein
VGAAYGFRVYGVELEERFVGWARDNIELHRRTWQAFGDTLPVIVRGDSRRLLEALGPVLAEVVVSSPPFSDRQAAPQLAGWRKDYSIIKDCERSYGTAPGQLGALPAGSVADAIVGSPPYEGSVTSVEKDLEVKAKALEAAGYDAKAWLGKARCSQLRTDHYGQHPDQLGNTTGPTFWESARDVVSQCRLILRPNGIAVWIVKDFVRAGQRVPFSADWAKLCEACGFTLVEWIKASLVKEERTPDLFAGETVKRKKRCSFFRHLHEKKLPPDDPRRINHEDVLIFRRMD